MPLSASALASAMKSAIQPTLPSGASAGDVQCQALANAIVAYLEQHKPTVPAGTFLTAATAGVPNAAPVPIDFN